MHIYNELFLKYGLILITLLIMFAYDIILLIFSFITINIIFPNNGDR